MRYLAFLLILITTPIFGAMKSAQINGQTVTVFGTDQEIDAVFQMVARTFPNRKTTINVASDPTPKTMIGRYSDHDMVYLSRATIHHSEFAVSLLGRAPKRDTKLELYFLTDDMLPPGDRGWRTAGPASTVAANDNKLPLTPICSGGGQPMMGQPMMGGQMRTPQLIIQGQPYSSEGRTIGDGGMIRDRQVIRPEMEQQGPTIGQNFSVLTRSFTQSKFPKSSSFQSLI